MSRDINMRTSMFGLLFLLICHVTTHVPMYMRMTDIGMRDWDWSEWSSWSQCVNGKMEKHRRTNADQSFTQEESIICDMDDKAFKPATQNKYSDGKQRHDDHDSAKTAVFGLRTRFKRLGQGQDSLDLGSIQKRDERASQLSSRNELEFTVSHFWRKLRDSTVNGTDVTPHRLEKWTGKPMQTYQNSMFVRRQTLQSGSTMHDLSDGETDLAYNKSGEVEDKCPGGYNFFFLSENGTGSCYKQGAFWKSWTLCRELCKANGSDLVSIETQSEFEHMKSTIFSAIDFPTLHVYWTSGEYQGEEKTWRWMATGEKITFFNWVPGQPTPMKSIWKYLGVESEGFGWFNAGVSAPYTMAICEATVMV